MRASMEVSADRHGLSLAASFIEKTLSTWSVPGEIRNRICVAADECITNVVLYAYSEETGNIRVSLGKNAGAIWATITDWGIPFDPTLHPPPDTTAPLEEREIGGLGIFLARKMTDQVSYSRVGDANELTIAVRLGERE